MTRPASNARCSSQSLLDVPGQLKVEVSVRQQSQLKLDGKASLQGLQTGEAILRDRPTSTRREQQALGSHQRTVRRFGFLGRASLGQCLAGQIHRSEGIG